MRKIVFDVDDVLWSLNRKMTQMTNIDYNKLVIYDINANPELTPDEKARIYAAYKDKALYEHIQWDESVHLINHINADIYVNSNVLSAEIEALKREQLKRVLLIPDKNIQMNIVANHVSKSIDSDTYIFVDDCPYNIMNSKAQYNIMLACPWNTSAAVQKELMSNGKRVIICETLGAIVHIINALLDDNSSLKQKIDDMYLDDPPETVSGKEPT